MARASARKSRSAEPGTLLQLWRGTRKLVLQLLALAVVLLLAVILVLRVVNPAVTPYMWSEHNRLGAIDRDWVALEDIAPVMARSAVAAEDANFCLHWGIDIDAVRAALADGRTRGASTISQQVVKNVFLWPDRSYVRKALEALITPAVEALWSKERILEVYLNVAEFDEGVFGIGPAAQATFGKPPADLTSSESALLAVVLPAPKSRDALSPTQAMLERATGIRAGAATIAADGRAACFQD